MPGCGNSDLSEKLITKLGLSNLEVLSVDYEEKVVQQMEENKPKDLNLKYVKGDVTKLEGINNDDYGFAIDKGTLDAIAVDNNDATVEMCNSYFKEMIRVLSKDGTLIIVSLLQPHVLKILLDYFMINADKSFLYNIKF